MGAAAVGAAGLGAGAGAGLALLEAGGAAGAAPACKPVAGPLERRPFIWTVLRFMWSFGARLSWIVKVWGRNEAVGDRLVFGVEIGVRLRGNRSTGGYRGRGEGWSDGGMG